MIGSSGDLSSGAQEFTAEYAETAEKFNWIIVFLGVLGDLCG